MSTCPSNQENFKGLTSVMLGAVFGPGNTHEDGGDSHGNIDNSDSYEGNSNEDRDDIGLFTSADNTE